jgi:molybdopterin molybdotransferase
MPRHARRLTSENGAMLIPIARARALVREATPRLATESVPIVEALDRVLAEDVIAAGDVPPFPSSAMDGYAIEHGPAGRILEVIGESRAGAPTDQRVGPDQAIRISTGAAVPDGATAVIRQEDVDPRDGAIVTHADVPEGDNVRPAGDVMAAGTTVLEAGTTIGAAELAAAIAAGAGALAVAHKPALQVFSTGDELRDPGEPLGPGEIHNSNSPMLVALATRCGASALPPRRLPDDRAATEQGLAQALVSSDVVIISGGVSVGPHDHVRPALERLGVREIFWGVSLQPGKPTWFGTREGTLVFGLPGNPVSAYVTFALFARPALLGLQGAREEPHTPTHAILAVPVRRNRQREQAIRVRLERDGGTILATPNGAQGSHVVTSLVGADALALIPPGDGELEAGATVALEPLPP